jgi:hypothetical protein
MSESSFQQPQYASLNSAQKLQKSFFIQHRIAKPSIHSLSTVH